jgi:uncharacterized repeat protein (TIGR03803 family)
VQPPIGSPSATNHELAGANTPAVNGFVERTIYSFTGADGGYPAAEDAPLSVLNGTFYGTTASGGMSAPGCGAYGCGAVFSATQTSTGVVEKTLYLFEGGSNGAGPDGPIVHYKGSWYGLTDGGGAYGYGAVFALSDAGKERTIYSFKDGADGANPFGGLLVYRGELYGTTSYGGSHNGGTAFAVTTSGAERVIHSFEFKSGANPYDGLTLMNGKFYGTTIAGGDDGFGTVFEMTPAGSEKVVYSFQYGNDGASPQAPLTVISGNLYGTTTDGGGQGYDGTAFEVTPTGTEQILHRFAESAKDGYFPQSTLLYHNGLLYGTTSLGGRRGIGIAFRLKMSGAEQVLHSFEGGATDGRNPAGGLTALGANLYGLATYGGSTECAYGEGCGVIFELKPN